MGKHQNQATTCVAITFRALLSSITKTPQDAFAILLAAHHPNSTLLGVSTVHGNASVIHTTYNSRAILHAIGRADTPVYRGASGPLVRAPCFAPSIHGESGLDGVTLLPTPRALPSSPLTNDQITTATIDSIAAALLAETANTAHLVVTGPLTNIALLFRAYPALRGHVAHLSIMGGAVGSNYTSAPLGRVDVHGEVEVRFGNWTPWAEFNIFCDPEAAGEVLGCAALQSKMTLCPLDLTHLVRGTKEVQASLFREEVTELSDPRALFKEVMTFFADAYRVQFGIGDGPPMHDPLAVYAVLCPDKFLDGDAERWLIDTVVGGEQDGQTVLSGPVKSGTRVPRGVDIEAFWKSIDDALASAESACRNIG